MRTDVPPSPVATGVAEWIRSIPEAIVAIVRGRVHLRPERLGRSLTMSDGRTYVPFRETVLDPIDERRPGPPAVLQARFRLAGMGPDQRLLHSAFKRLCIATTPFFIGIDGFRSKVWMVDPFTGDFAGLYEWDDLPSASAYAEGLAKVLRALSCRGSVSYELVDHTTLDDYIRRSSHINVRSSLDHAQGDASVP